MGKNSRLISEVQLFIVGLILFLQQASFRYKNPLSEYFQRKITILFHHFINFMSMKNSIK